MINGFDNMEIIANLAEIFIGTVKTKNTEVLQEQKNELVVGVGCGRNSALLYANENTY